MKAKKKVAVVCLSIGAVLLLLTAFSGVNAWNQEGDADSTGQTDEVLTEGMIWSETKIPEEGSSEGTVAGDAASGAGNAAAVQAITETASVPEESAAEPASASPEETQTAETAEAGTEAETAGDESQEAAAETDAEEGAAEETAAEEEDSALAQAEVDYFEGQFMVTVTDNTALNVREEPDTESAWVG